MGSDADLKAILTSLCSRLGNEDERACAELLEDVEKLRCKLLEIVDDTAPEVLNNSIIFRSVFCFLLDVREAIQYLEELGRRTEHRWSTLVEMEPLQFVQKIRTQSTSPEEKADVVVVYLWNALRLHLTTTETLNLAAEARERKTMNTGDVEDRILNVQKDLHKELVSCIHFGDLMHSRDADEQAVCAEQARQMFAAFSIMAQLLFDHGEYQILRKMMALAEGVFHLTDDVLHVAVNLRTDISVRFLPEMIRTLVVTDPELPCGVPYRMCWYYLYAQTEHATSGGEEPWRVHQHLSNANHYCSDKGTTYDDEGHAFMCWLLYGLSLFECKEYATAEVILRMDHMSSTGAAAPPTSRTASDLIHQCAELQAEDEGSTKKEFLLYFGKATPRDLSQETTAWNSIFDDPAVRKYSPRSIPDYVEICARLARTDDDTSEHNIIQSLVLESLGPFLDLAYQAKKPRMKMLSDHSVNIYGGSVNESLDVQSHLEAAAAGPSVDEVPDIDIMMAVTPAQIGLHVELVSSATTSRYAYLRNKDTGERMPSFELLVDSFPIAFNKVARFVADAEFARDYKVLSIAIHGPAIATKIRRGDDVILSYDHVPAFWIKSWPDVAEEWIGRRREYGWPTATVIEDIRRDGVFLVAACHSQSEDPKNEWRVSFTMAERVLVDTLSSTQRLTYIYAKLIWMAFLKPGSYIVSYHLKNALLWLCEQRSQEFWRGDNLVVCVGDIFRWLRQEISQGHLPNYFIAKDNMIPTSAEPADTDKLIQSLDHIIDDVFQNILDADAQLRHIALLDELRFADLAETVKCRPLTNAAESLIQRLRQFVGNLGDHLLDNRQEFLRKLDEAIDSL